ncbi:YajQ family cyclic di-GMP-binding protein, partial [Salmonella enterica subsp. enterica]|nr:YajQ family cyclic di-GMP-binding protein [Salmonella enterica subsp. enterica serovar Infantis]
MSMAFLLSEKQLLFRLFLFIEEERMPSFDIVSEVDL